jgi:lipoate-protein ligase A
MLHRLLSPSFKRPFSNGSKIHLRWLDLRASGLSMVERLCLEEALLRHTVDNWMVVGTHEPFPHKYLNTIELPSYMEGEWPNPDCLIVMGIGGKPDLLLNTDKVKEDRVLVCKRFSGGGTVVLDSSSLWTTVIGRTVDFAHVQPYPREIMEWSASQLFGPTFEHMTENARPHGQKTLVLDTKSCSATENRGQVIELDSSEIPKFSLRENDYVFGDLKVGGNAQSIIKDGWLHHTSFLWDYEPENMEYLALPQKRPEYRGDRAHGEFLVKLRPYFVNKNSFFSSLLHTCEDRFQIEKVAVHDAMTIIEKLGGMDAWWKANRTRVVHDL